MTEIKCNIFGRVWLLKNFFFECLFFSEYDIQMLLFAFWLRIGHPLSTLATGARERGRGWVESRLCAGAARGRGNWACHCMPKEVHCIYMLIASVFILPMGH